MKKTSRSTTLPTLRDAKIISLVMENESIRAAQRCAFKREISFSKWMREAAREKLARERRKNGK